MPGRASNIQDLSLQNSDRITKLNIQSTTNTDNITTNTDNITTNTDNITTNTDNINSISSRVQNIEQSPIGNYGALLYCPVDMYQNQIVSNICIPTNINASLQKSSKMTKFAQVWLALLNLPDAESSNQSIKYYASSILYNFIFPLVTQQHSPWYEYAQRNVNAITNSGTEGSQARERYYSMLTLGAMCLCNSSSPVTCQYTAVCGLACFSVNWIVSTYQFSPIRIDGLFSPLTTPTDADGGTVQSIIETYIGTIYPNQPGTPLAQLYVSIWESLTGQGKYPLYFEVHKKTGLPSIYLPFNDILNVGSETREYKMASVFTLIDEGYLGFTAEECNLAILDFERCFGSAYTDTNEFFYDPATVPQGSSTFNLINESDLSNMLLVNTKDVMEKYENLYFKLRLLQDFAEMGQWSIKNEMTVANYNKNNITPWTKIPADWDKDDPIWKYAIYELLPHGGLFASDGSGSYTAKQIGVLNIKGTPTLIAGEYHDGPGNIKEQKVSPYTGNTALLGSPSSNFISYQDPTTGNYYTWTQPVMDTLINSNDVYFGANSLSPGDAVSVIQFNALPPNLQGQLDYSSIQPPFPSNHLINGWWIMSNHFLELNMDACCFSSKYFSSQASSYSRFLIESSCSASNQVTEEEPFNFTAFGDNYLNLGVNTASKMNGRFFVGFPQPYSASKTTETAKSGVLVSDKTSFKYHSRKCGYIPYYLTIITNNVYNDFLWNSEYRVAYAVGNLPGFTVANNPINDPTTLGMRTFYNRIKAIPGLNSKMYRRITAVYNSMSQAEGGERRVDLPSETGEYDTSQKIIDKIITDNFLPNSTNLESLLGLFYEWNGDGWYE